MESEPGNAADRVKPAGETDQQALLVSVDGVLSDGRQARIPLYDDGLLRGDGAFEVVRCYAGRPFALAEHLARLARTCATIRLNYSAARLEDEVHALLAHASVHVADMRIVLTRAGRRIVMLEQSDLCLPPARLAFIVDSPRIVLAGAKTLSYAGNMLAKRLAEERGCRDALLITPDERVMEAQQASFFWVTSQGDLCTPPLSEGILDSITRRILLDTLPVDQRVCRKTDALDANEAFLVSTTREVQPVEWLEDHILDNAPGQTTRRAIAAYRHAVAGRLGLTSTEFQRVWKRQRAPL